MDSRQLLAASILLAGTFAFSNASAQTIRSYGNQAESEYGNSTSSTSGNTVRRVTTAGAPMPPPPQSNETSTSPNSEGKESDGKEDGGSSANHLTVFNTGGTSNQRPVEELKLSETEMYRGVIPGKRDSVSHLKRDGTGRNRITWIGFQPKEKSSRVFFQTASAADYEIVSGDSSTELVVRFTNTEIPVRNFRRFIDTTGYDWNVRRIDAKQVGRAVEITIKLASDEEPIVSRNGGYLYLDFQKKVATEDTSGQS